MYSMMILYSYLDQECCDINVKCSFTSEEKF